MPHFQCANVHFCKFDLTTPARPPARQTSSHNGRPGPAGVTSFVDGPLVIYAFQILHFVLLGMYHSIYRLMLLSLGQLLAIAILTTGSLTCSESRVASCQDV